MILSRLQLRADALKNGFVRACLGRGAYGHHQLIAAAYGDKDATATERILFRQETGSSENLPCFLVLATTAPEGAGAERFRIEYKPFHPRLQPGDRLAFDIRFNPVVARRDGDDQAKVKRRSKRIDFVYDTLRRRREADKEEQRRPEIVQTCGEAWLVPRLERAGLREVAGLRCDGYRQHRVRRGGKKEIRFSTLDGQGLATVADPDALLVALASGIGPAKGFGCGLLLIRRT